MLLVERMRSADGERLTPRRSALVREFVSRTEMGSRAVGEDRHGNRIRWAERGGLVLTVTGRDGWRRFIHVDVECVEVC